MIREFCDWKGCEEPAVAAKIDGAGIEICVKVWPEHHAHMGLTGKDPGALCLKHMRRNLLSLLLTLEKECAK